MNPSWWVRSFEAASSSKAPHLSPLELSCDSGLTPALNSVELSALGIVLSNIQKQLLSGHQKITLDPVQHRKFVSSTSRSRIFSFERILQILTGLRLLSGNKNEGFEVVPLFKDEVWKRKGYYNGLVIELGLADLGSELIFGLAEPYSEFERFVSKKPRAQRHLSSQGPLCLWQSIWLDLQGLEQSLLLRIEQCMQWENRWLRLDGVFGAGISELFKNLELPKARGKSSQWSNFRVQQRVLERLGRKLMEHGLLTFDQSDDYLALGDDNGDFSLIWQAGPEYLTHRDSGFYGASVGAYLRTRVMEKNLDNIMSVVCGRIYNRELGHQLKSIWGQISSSKDDYLGLIHGNLPIMASSLFFEWFMRQLPGHSFPVPSDIMDSQLLRLASPENGGALEERFNAFREELKSQDNILDDLENVSGLTLASSKTQSNSELYSYFIELGQIHAEFSENILISNIENNVQIPLEPNIEKRVRKEFDNPPPANLTRPSDLKKAATEELSRLRTDSPEKYKTLKSAYINTLDPEKKKIIAEVMGRLQPKTFDDHLKNSLIKYMVENPDSWLPHSKDHRL